MEKFCSNQPLAKIPRKSYGASHKDQMSPLQWLFKIPQDIITPRVLAHTCGPAVSGGTTGQSQEAAKGGLTFQVPFNKMYQTHQRINSF